MSKRKTEFWWASVAGADCEPVEVTKKDGERVAYTCGCGATTRAETAEAALAKLIRAARSHGVIYAGTDWQAEVAEAARALAHPPAEEGK